MELRQLVRNLYGIDQPQGCTEEDIAKLRARFGAVPAAVEDFWRGFGRTQWLNYGQDTWCLPEEYELWSWLSEKDYLILLNENQGCCQAGIRKEDLTLPDPPVYEFVNDEAGEMIAPSVSDFLEAALLYEGSWLLDYSEETFFDLSDADMAVIREKLAKRPAALKHWMEMEVTFYSSRPDNLVVIMDVGDQYQTLYGAATEESYAALMEVMEGLGEPI